MKRKFLYIIFLIPVLSACLDNPEMTTGIVNGKEKPTVKTILLENPFTEDGNLLFQGEIESKGKAEIIKRGFYYGTHPDSISTLVESNSNTEIFTGELKNTVGQKTYYWKAYAQNEYGFDFGEIFSQTTQKDEPTVETDTEANHVLDDGVLLFTGKIVSRGRSKITERGFYWSKDSNSPGSNDSIIKSDDHTDVFTCELMNTSGQQTYYWRAYAKNDYGIDYGEVDSLLTVKYEPTVETDFSVNPILSDGVLVFKGKIVYEGISKITEKGFCISIVSKERTVNDTITISSDSDEFTYILNGASGEKTYYWKAFAKNKYGGVCGETRSCETPKIWIKKSFLNAKTRGRSAVFLVDDKIFVTCGETETGRVPLKENWCYSITENRWDDSLAFLGSERIEMACFTIDNLAYFITGRNPTNQAGLNDFFKYDNSSTAKWTQIAEHAPMQARYHATAFSLKGKGYLIGGFSGTIFNDVWQYNPIENSWIKIANFPVPINGAISISDNKRAFTGFGTNLVSARTLWEFNEENETWKEFATLPNEVGDVISSGAIIGNTIYILDGDNHVVWSLNMTDKKWKKKSFLPGDFINDRGEGGNQLMLTSGSSNSIFVGFEFTKVLYEYCPLWDN